MSSTKDNNQPNPVSSTNRPIPSFTNPTDDRIYRLLIEKGPMTRSTLMQATSIARSTIYDALLRMIIKGYIRKFSNEPTGPGRPKVYFQTNGNSSAGAPAPIQTIA